MNIKFQTLRFGNLCSRPRVLVSSRDRLQVVLILVQVLAEVVLVLVLKSADLLLVLKSRLESTLHYISLVLSHLSDYWKHVSK